MPLLQVIGRPAHKALEPFYQMSAFLLPGILNSPSKLQKAFSDAGYLV